MKRTPKPAMSTITRSPSRDLVQHPAAALEVQADLVDASLHRHVQLAQRGRADGAVGGEQVAMLEVPHGGLQRRVEQQRFGAAGGRGLARGGLRRGGRGRAGIGRQRGGREVAGEREPLAQQRHALVAHAGLQRRAGRQLRPAAERRDAAIRGERGAPGPVHPVVRPHLLDARAHPVPGDRVVHELHCRGFADVAHLEIPARIERHRVDLAEIQVVEDQRIGIARQQVERGALERGQRAAPSDQPPQRREVVVIRAQAVVLDVLQQVEQRLQAARVPKRPEAIHLVQLWQRAGGAQRLSGRLDPAAAGTQRVDALADRLDHGVGRARRCGLRGGRRQQLHLDRIGGTRQRRRRLRLRPRRLRRRRPGRLCLRGQREDELEQSHGQRRGGAGQRRRGAPDGARGHPSGAAKLYCQETSFRKRWYWASFSWPSRSSRSSRYR
jgi:hypothetical protein